MNHNFIRQIDSFSCGPTALYNLLLWADASQNQPQFRRSLRRIFHDCLCGSEFGTLTRLLDKNLQKICQQPDNRLFLASSALVGHQLTPASVYKHLSTDQAILLRFHWSTKDDPVGGEHYVVLIKDPNTPPKTYSRFKRVPVLMINPDFPDHPDRIIHHLSHKELKELLIYHEYPPNTKYTDSQDLVCPYGWIVGRN